MQIAWIFSIDYRSLNFYITRMVFATFLLMLIVHILQRSELFFQRAEKGVVEFNDRFSTSSICI